MGKGDKRGAKKPRTKHGTLKPITLAGGVTAPNRPTGRDRRHTGETEARAMQTALTARATRSFGEAGETEMLKAKHPMYGSDMGRCIALDRDPRDAAELWQTWCALLDAVERYRIRILGMTGYPKGMAITMEPERIQADQSHSIDTRSPAEKDQAAKDRAEQWSDMIAALPTPMHKWALAHAMHQGGTEAAPLWLNAAITPAGKAAVSALEELHRERSGG